MKIQEKYIQSTIDVRKYRKVYKKLDWRTKVQEKYMKTSINVRKYREST